MCRVKLGKCVAEMSVQMLECWWKFGWSSESVLTMTSVCMLEEIR